MLSTSVMYAIFSTSHRSLYTQYVTSNNTYDNHINTVVTLRPGYFTVHDSLGPRGVMHSEVSGSITGLYVVWTQAPTSHVTRHTSHVTSHAGWRTYSWYGDHVTCSDVIDHITSHGILHRQFDQTIDPVNDYRAQ